MLLTLEMKELTKLIQWSKVYSDWLLLWLGRARLPTLHNLVAFCHHSRLGRPPMPIMVASSYLHCKARSLGATSHA
ncbi:hypothetical protein FRX31_035416 [Thalictrum thalictroides]|uniref:Uncharacterized protein n=1 Tax=Thalictrum thalictroides TaxID=46969 RepID=A0A7J6UR41_THATH|nr:hypothetical protein FRX31_035416 [Thalictrum thalictroides]